MGKRKIVNLAGNVLVLLSIVFIVDRTIKYKFAFVNVFTLNMLATVAICIMIYSLLVIIHAYVFCHILNIIHGAPVSTGNSIYTFCKTNLYKYLPGNVFHYVGRNKIAIDEQIPHSTVVFATLADTFLLLLSAVVVAMIFAGRYTFTWLMQISHEYWTYMAVVLCVIAGILIPVLYRFTKMIKVPMVIIERFTLNNVFRVTVIYMFVFIINGLILSWIMYAAGANVAENMFVIIGTYALSWIIGFLTPGAPGGIGVREALLSLLLTGYVRTDLIIMAVVTTRIVNIFGDVIGVFISRKIRLLAN